MWRHELMCKFRNENADVTMANALGVGPASTKSVTDSLQESRRDSDEDENLAETFTGDVGVNAANASVTGLTRAKHVAQKSPKLDSQCAANMTNRTETAAAACINRTAPSLAEAVTSSDESEELDVSIVEANTADTSGTGSKQSKHIAKKLLKSRAVTKETGGLAGLEEMGIILASSSDVELTVVEDTAERLPMASQSRSQCAVTMTESFHAVPDCAKDVAKNLPTAHTDTEEIETPADVTNNDVSMAGTSGTHTVDEEHAKVEETDDSCGIDYSEIVPLTTDDSGSLWMECVDDSVYCIVEELIKNHSGMDESGNPADVSDIGRDMSNTSGTRYSQAKSLRVVQQPGSQCVDNAVDSSDTGLATVKREAKNVAKAHTDTDEIEGSADVEQTDMNVASTCVAGSMRARHTINNLPEPQNLCCQCSCHCAVSTTSSSCVRAGSAKAVAKKFENRTPWSTAEKDAVHTLLSAFIESKTVPGKKHCEKAIAESNGVLSRRSWTQVKFAVKNITSTSSDRPSSPKAVAKKFENRMPWTTAEKDAVCSLLSAFIERKTVPGKKHCEKAIAESNGVLSGRSWRHVKFAVKNIITVHRPRHYSL